MRHNKNKEKVALIVLFKSIVTFKYPARPDIQVINKLSLKINPGQTVAFVGSSGCGKSTCIQLLQRFYDIESGALFIDNRNIQTYNVAWLRTQLGVVNQEPVLFGIHLFKNLFKF